jgi:transcriptional regulator with XRE-family HTH domain
MATKPKPAPGTVAVRSARDFGAVIREGRATRGWTQAELAERASVGRQWLVAVERGRHSGAEIGMVLSVLTALGVELLARPEARPPPGDDPDGRPAPDAGVDLDAVLRGLAGGSADA